MKVSFVLAALNEEESIGLCLDWIEEFVHKSGLDAEVVVVDNGSVDKTAEIAESKGVRVVSEQKKGYGAAFIKGINEALGDYIIMADADGTYDFRESDKFIEKLDKGYDLVMGSRFKGRILKGAMPWPNRYIGNPLLSGMLRLFYRTNLSDIHCGMRAFTKKAFLKMNLSSPGMEFASEMVIAALREKLKICEVPITYFPRKGESKLSRIRDAWRHIRFMLLYSPTWLYLVPGGTFSILGFLLVCLLVKGPVRILFHSFDIHFMVLGVLFLLLGLQVSILGILAKLYGIEHGVLKKDKVIDLFLKYFRLDGWVFLGAGLFLLGLTANCMILWEWVSLNFGPFNRVREALFASTLSIVGIEIVASSFLFGLFKEGIDGRNL